MPKDTQDIVKPHEGDHNQGAKQSTNDNWNLLAIVAPGISASAVVAGGVCLENKSDRAISPTHLLFPALIGMDISKNIAKDPAVRAGFNDLLKMQSRGNETGIKAGMDILEGIGDAHKQRGNAVDGAMSELRKLDDGKPLGPAKLDPILAAALKLRNGELTAERKLLEGGMKADKRVWDSGKETILDAVRLQQTVDRKKVDLAADAMKLKQNVDGKTVDLVVDAVKMKQDVDRKTVDLAVDAVKLKQDVDRKTVDLVVDVFKLKQDADRRTVDLAVETAKSAKETAGHHSTAMAGDVERVAKNTAQQAKPLIETGWQLFKKANPVIGLLGKIKDAAEK